MEEALSKPGSSTAMAHRGRSVSGLRERLLARGLNALAIGQLTVDLPSGARLAVAGAGAEDGIDAACIIRNNRAVTRLITKGDVGFAEGYIEGDWDTPDLGALLSLGMHNEKALSGTFRRSAAFEAFNRFRHRMRANSRRGSRRNIEAHYDLGNDFYQPWLDSTMSYSAALFDSFDEPMEVAQHRKYHKMAMSLDLQPGDHVLEIGCGWGGFAETAAKDFGCKVTALTLSREQAAFSRKRMADLGLDGLVDIRLQDYRDVDAQFDKIASIEMFEAVGEAYWPVYFAALKRYLKPGGKAALQSITIGEEYFEGYRASPDFIQRYIFPGGMLPSPNGLAAAANAAGLQVSDRFFFGSSYAETLRRWEADFHAAWPEIEKIGFDERFRRMWYYYLKYCEIGFDEGRIDVGQFVLER